MTFPQTHMWDAPFCPTAFDSGVDLDGLCDQLTDGLWENNFNLGASKTVSEFCECSISSLSAWGGQISVPNFEKSGVRKKNMSVWRGLATFLAKKDFVKQNMISKLNFKC